MIGTKKGITFKDKNHTHFLFENTPGLTNRTLFWNLMKVKPKKNNKRTVSCCTRHQTSPVIFTDLFGLSTRPQHSSPALLRITQLGSIPINFFPILLAPEILLLFGSGNGFKPET